MVLVCLSGAVVCNWLILPLVILTLILTCFLMRRQISEKIQALLLYGGFAIAGYCCMSVSRPVPEPALQGYSDHPCVCRVLNKKITGTGTTRMEVQIIIPGGKSHLSSKGLIYTRDTVGAYFATGDTLIVPMHWEPIRNNGIPHSFDYAGFYARKGIYARMFCKTGTIILAGKHRETKADFLSELRADLEDILTTCIKEPQTLALLKAMLLGDEGDIDPETRAAYSDTGIIHIVSISGAHVALLFAIINMLLYWLSGKSRKWMVFITSMTVITLYVAMAGAPSSAVRAALMFLLIQIGVLSEKQANPFNQLAAAALLMLLFRPVWLFNIGFQLSFLAVLSLLLFYRPLMALWPTNNAILRWLRNAMAASIAAEILVAPLVAYYFHSFPLLFLPANLIAAAGMTLLEISGILLLLLSQIGPVRSLLSVLITGISRIFHYLIAAMQHISIGSFKTIWLSIPVLVLLYLLIISGAIYLNNRSKYAAWLCVISVLSLTALRLHHTCFRQQKDILVVWNSHLKSNALLMRRNTGFVLPDYTADPEDISVLLMRQGITPSFKKAPALFIINRSSVAVCDSLTVPSGMFPIDVLLINGYVWSAKPLDFINSFHPSVIVLSRQLSHKRLLEWQATCRASHTRLHYVPDAGAFIFPGPVH
ncbi:MAG: ComEC/Rec2 family competence protein [Chitinophagaceae bacterium]